MSIQTKQVIFFLAVFLTVMIAMAAPGQANTKAIVGATLIDGTSKPALADSIVVIKDDRIAAVGPKSTVAIPPDAEVISAAGKYIIPGLIDSLAHYRAWGGELYLNYGVTSVLDVGNIGEWMVALKEGMAKGKVKRIPRIYASGYMLDGPPRGGFQPQGSDFALVRNSHQSLYFTQPDAARRTVKDFLEKDNFDFISVMVYLSPEVLQAIADETHKHGKRVFGHIGPIRDNPVYEFIRAGGDTVMHGFPIAMTTMSQQNMEALRRGEIFNPFTKMEVSKFDDLVKFMVEHGTYFEPMLGRELIAVSDRDTEFKSEAYRLLGNPALQYIPVDMKLDLLSTYDRFANFGNRLGNWPYIEALSKAELEQFRSGYRNMQLFVRKFAQAGGRTLVGTDAVGDGQTPGLTVQQEMIMLVDAGLTPMQAIEAASRTAAESIGKQDEIGTVQPGRFADFVILDANPLQDIGNIQKISKVFQNGEPVELGYHWNYSLPFSNPDTDPEIHSTGAFAVPRFEDMSPKMVVEGAPGLTLKITGQGFMTRSVVELNGVPLPTKFQSKNLLTADVPASLLLAPGTWSVDVTNPPPAGGRSNVLGFIVRYR